MKRAAPPAPLPEGAQKVRMVTAMFDAIAPRYDLMNRLMTAGLDTGWRRRAVSALELAPGAAVVDLACGTGDLCAILRKRGLHPTGVDLSAGMLAAATVDSPLVRADVTTLPFPAGTFDGATCGFALRNVVDLNALFLEMARVVRSGARVALLEVSEPSSRLLRAGHHLYFGRVVPKLGGLLSDAEAYRYLPRSVDYLPAPARLQELVTGAGFRHVRRTPLAGGVAQLLVGTRA